MNIFIRACNIEDLDDLTDISYTTYNDTFRSANKASTINAYLDEAFNRKKILSELQTANSCFYFIYADDVPAGYLKLNEQDAQSDIMDPCALEIERIYVKMEFKGKGLGKRLLEFAGEQGRKRKKEYLWLGVWEKNTPAIEFYRKNGFAETGKHFFKMGDELQSDLIMSKKL